MHTEKKKVINYATDAYQRGGPVVDVCGLYYLVWKTNCKIIKSFFTTSVLYEFGHDRFYYINLVILGVEQANWGDGMEVCVSAFLYL